MSVTNLARYGTTTAPALAARQRRQNRADDHKAHLQGLKRYRAEFEAGKEVIRFDQATFAALNQASRKGLGGASTFWSLMSMNGFSEDGQTCIRITADTARQWAAWMRQPDVAAPADVLSRLDAIAARTEPRTA